MSKSAASKTAYAIRREMRLRRDKTAAMMLASLITITGTPDSKQLDVLVKSAVMSADKLLAELDRTAPKPEENAQS